MNIKNIKPFNGDLINVIVETPHASRNKFDYDFDLDIFKLKKTLPQGMIFPFDFGFIPNTKGADGDPLDVLVIMDQKAYPGCLLECRVLGILEAEQTERDKQTMRNDRIIAVSNYSAMYEHLKTFKNLNKDLLNQIENFFINYNNQSGKKYKPIKWASPTEAKQLIKAQIVK